MTHEKEGFDRLVGAFFGRVHDIKNAVNCIGGFAHNLNDMAREKDLDPADVLKYSEAILKSARELDKFTNDILSFANDEPQKTLVNINGLIAEQMHSVFGMAGDIKIIFDPKKDRLLFIDQKQIGSAIRELLQNAVYASQSSGGKEIEVTIYPHDDSTKERHSLCVKIKNCGHIPEENLDKIFQLSYTTRKKGSGIGLTAARKAVEMHGGKIKCRNEGDSVVFRIFLPRNV